MFSQIWFLEWLSNNIVEREGVTRVGGVGGGSQRKWCNKGNCLVYEKHIVFLETPSLSF